MATPCVFSGSPRHNRNNNNVIRKPTSISSTPFSQTNEICLLISSSTPTSSKQYNKYNRHRANSQVLPSSPGIDLSHQNSSHSLSRHIKRKSAVELLADSKSFFIKSDHPSFKYRRNILSSPTHTSVPFDGQCYTFSRRCFSSSSDILHNKLRTLLNTAAERKRFSSSASSSEITSKFDVSENLTKQCTLTSEPNSDISVFFPNTFLPPQLLPPANILSDDDIYAHDVDSFLTENYQTISPPAEYAEENVQRSYSHSHQYKSFDDDDDAAAEYTKSLPDLHSQIYRHSPHSEVLSCCSRGNRSNKSSSSFNYRDSGGSSGHYTHRSEPGCNLIIPPPLMHDFRRDSGSSTQHSSGNSYNYALPPPQYDYTEYCNASNDSLLNFATLEVPEAFQDNFTSATSKITTRPSPNIDKGQIYHGNDLYITHSSRPTDGTGHISRFQDPEHSSPLSSYRRQRSLRLKQRSRYTSFNDRNCRSEDDRRPIFRSKSDIGDRSYHCKRNYSSTGRDVTKNINTQTTFLSKKENTIQKSLSRKSMSDIRLSTLDKFFENLGITSKYLNNADNSDESIHSSPIFFSNTSTIDSNRLPDGTDTNSQNAQTYRSNEHMSIVERNARIIKWLCNCRKFSKVS